MGCRHRSQSINGVRGAPRGCARVAWYAYPTINKIIVFTLIICKLLLLLLLLLCMRIIHDMLWRRRRWWIKEKHEEHDDENSPHPAPSPRLTPRPRLREMKQMAARAEVAVPTIQGPGYSTASVCSNYIEPFANSIGGISRSILCAWSYHIVLDQRKVCFVVTSNGAKLHDKLVFRLVRMV